MRKCLDLISVFRKILWLLLWQMDCREIGSRDASSKGTAVLYAREAQGLGQEMEKERKGYCDFFWR